MLGWKYYELMEQFKKVFHQQSGKEVKELASAFNLASLIRSFSEFAGYAFTMLYYSQKQ